MKGEGTGGRPLEHSRREIVNAVLYVTRSRCSSRMLPTDFPPWQTVYRFSPPGVTTGRSTWCTTHSRRGAHEVKKRAGGARKDAPSAGIVDSRSLRRAGAVVPDPRL